MGASRQMMPSSRLRAACSFPAVGHGAVLLDEGKGGLFPDPRHTGDVVRAVPHQGLGFDQLKGLHPVLFPHRLRGHGEILGPPGPGGGQNDGDLLVHQLEGVPVPGEKEGFPVLFLGGPGEGSQDVVGLVPGAFHHRPPQGGQQFLDHRQLLGQLRGHPLPLGLVAVVQLVAEGGGGQVKGKDRHVRLQLLQQLEDNVEEAVDGVGVLPVFGGEKFDAVKGPVQDAVGIHDE